MPIDRIVINDRDICGKHAALTVCYGPCPAGCAGCSAAAGFTGYGRFGILPGLAKSMAALANQAVDQDAPEQARELSGCSALAVVLPDMRANNIGITDVANLFQAGCLHNVLVVAGTDFDTLIQMMAVTRINELRIRVPYIAFKDTTAERMTTAESLKYGEAELLLARLAEYELWRDLKLAGALPTRLSFPSYLEPVLTGTVIRTTVSYWVPIWSGAYSDTELETLGYMLHGRSLNLVPISCPNRPAEAPGRDELQHAVEVTGATVRRMEHYGLTHYQMVQDESEAADNAPGA